MTKPISIWILTALSLHFVHGQGSGCYYCPRNPCRSTKCPSITGARCRNKCCKARFFDKYGRDVTDQCNSEAGERKQCPPLPLGTFGICVEACFSGDGFSRTCPSPKLCCSNGCGHVCKDPYYPDCPGGRPLACKPPACSVTTCPRQIQATCDPVCFGCIARFFDQFGNEVTKNCKCPNGVNPVTCVDDPCRTAKCGKRKDVVCRTDSCGSCRARFYNKGGREVKCPNQYTLCPPPVKGFLLPCKKSCRRDRNCPDRNHKCCTYGCRKVCRTAIPGNCDSIRCAGPGCQLQKCYTHLFAKCQGSCNDCFANFFDKFGNEINDQCQCRKRVKPVKCSKNLCNQRNCRGFPNAECRVNSCGKCKVEFFDKNKRKVKCKPAARTCPRVSKDFTGTCALECKSDRDCRRGLKCCSNSCGQVCRTPLPANCNTINCFAPACDTTTCATHTRARCRGECSGCFPLFFDRFGNDITSQCNCPGRIFEAQCAKDLCDNKQCIADPYAECRINRCGGCSTAFFDRSGKKVACDRDLQGQFCPAPVQGIPVSCKQVCKQDSDCGKDRKCCTYGCRRVCRTPIPDCRTIRCAGPGCQLQQCPAHVLAACEGSCNNCFANYFDKFGNEINDQCQCKEGVEISKCSKSVCSGKTCRRNPNAECRINSCGGCKAEFYDENKVKVNCDSRDYDERCPKVRSNDGGFCNFRCNSNQDCNGKQICCPTPGCGSSCRFPPQDDRCPGTRPLIITNPPTLCLKSRCTDNTDCASDQICCDDGCSQDCISYPYTDPRCPHNTGVGPCINLCGSNNDCKQGEICCGFGCGTKCRKLFTQDERCPSTISRNPSPLLVNCPASNCYDAEDCAHDQICCSIGCSRRCMQPPKFDDRCPLPQAPVSTISCVMECTSNNDCRSDYMCCGLYCGSQCTPKPRTCDPGQFLAKCVYLCEYASCPEFPNAKCRVHGCDGCKAEFYDDSNRLIKNCRVRPVGR